MNYVLFKPFDVNYKLKKGDVYVALNDISFDRYFIKKGTILKIRDIGMNVHFHNRTVRRTDIMFDKCDGVFLYGNLPISGMPTYYHNFSFDELASIKVIRRKKLNKLNEYGK